jgi:predicted transcriptional regulator
MSHVVSIRLPDEQAKRLKRQARRMQRPPSEAARMLLDEALRQTEFPLIEFRDTRIGRQAHLKGRRVQVWMVMSIAEGYKNNIKKIAKHLQWPEELVEAAFAYTRAFPKEIREAIEDNDAMTPDKFRETYPQLAPFMIPE